ncbi:MAG: hypothetical protein IPM52_00035 [Bacteroidetes bacterium]|nr:hypothetical protein [Bacteroidota bacterium]
MKKTLLFLMLWLWITAALNAQPLTGTKNIPGDYATLAAAIADLNANGVGTGGVTLNLLAGNPQTAPAGSGTTGGGYIIGGTGSALLTTTASDKQVIIQGNGNTITATSSLVTGQLNDAIFKIIGADWITITGFVMEENSANTTTTASSNNMTEWGVAVLYVSTTDNCQNITISNNTIDLNRTYQNTFGIYVNATHSNTAPTTSATATGTNGGNHNLVIKSNNITDVNQGIVVVGPTAAADMNNGVTIGGSTASDGNTITNFGTTRTFSGYANVSGTVNGILMRNSINYSVSRNTVESSAGGVTSGILNGIHQPQFSNVPTGTFTNSINNNGISLRSGVASGAVNGINCPIGSASTTSTMNINNNNFYNFSHTVTASGTITFITNASTHQHCSISNNTFTNITVNTTGSVNFISNNYNAAASGTKNVNNNSIVTAFNKTGAGGTVTLFNDNGGDPSGAVNNTNNNDFSNITVTGSTTIAGISNTNGGFPTKSVSNNVLSNWTGGTSAITAININYDGGTTTVSNNQVSNITGGGTITGISFGTSGTGTTNVSGNTVYGLTGSGTGAVTGLAVGASGTSPATRNIFKNKIYDLQNTNAGGSVFGITVSSGFQINVYNNLIGNLTAPSASGTDVIRGINITSTTANSTINASYNTVYLNATSTGTNFGTTGIFHTASTTATTAALNLRNNIIVNLSTPNGTGRTVAYRRSAGTANMLNNYASASNNNLFYAGTPSTTNLIYSDGTSTAQTISAYKSGVFTAGTIALRDAASVTENPTFQSTSGSSSDFLKIDLTTPTQIESGGTPISGITDDYYGTTRNATTPDIGAFEGAMTLLDLLAPSISYTTLGNGIVATSKVLTGFATITDASGVETSAGLRPRLYYKEKHRCQ